VYPVLWAGAVSLYGVSNLKALVKAMHNFESHYVQQLVLKDGLTMDEVEAIYKAEVHTITQTKSEQRSCFYRVTRIRWCQRARQRIWKRS
jgi:predicted DNA-binding protein (UPF0251 family)